MDFFSGVFNPQPVILLISLTTSSAVARNSGLLVPADGAAAAGAVVACWANAKGAEERTKVPRSKKAREHPNKRQKGAIEGQDSRFSEMRLKSELGERNISERNIHS